VATTRAGSSHRYRQPTRATVCIYRERGRERYTCIDICLYYYIFSVSTWPRRAQALLFGIGNPRVLQCIYRERGRERYTCIDIRLYYNKYIAFQRGHDAHAGTIHCDRQPARAPVHIYTYAYVDRWTDIYI